jgi:hypothetical protein
MQMGAAVGPVMKGASAAAIGELPLQPPPPTTKTTG